MKIETVLGSPHTEHSVPANTMNASAGMPFPAEVQRFPERSMTRDGGSRLSCRKVIPRSRSS